MNKFTKFFISFLFIFTYFLFFQSCFAKYVIESTYTIAHLDIDRCKPSVSLTDITSSNTNYNTYANKTHVISGHLKISEKNIVKNDISPTNLKIRVGNDFISPNFKSFSLVSQNSDEKIYEFSFTNCISDGALVVFIPQGIVEDKSGLTNNDTYLFTGIYVDNTPPVLSFKEVSIEDNKSQALITSNETIRPIDSWNISSNYMFLSHDFQNAVSYAMPVLDWAENSSEVLVDIKNATNISLQYGTYDDYSKQTIVTCGKVSAPATISSNSICKSEVIMIRSSGLSNSNPLLGKAYVHTYWGDTARNICRLSELTYYHGYNPSNTASSTSSWYTINKNNLLYFNKIIFTQLGGVGLNVANAKSSNIKTPIPADIAKQYLYGISGIQFKLSDSSSLSVVYQSYVKGIGWLPASFDGEENFYSHNKPISAFRINFVPKSQKQYLVDFWNRDIGTNNK